MSVKAVLLRNITANWLGFAVQIAVTFLLTPFVLHSLGETRYGVWLLAAGITGYYGLLDLGLRASLTQHLARHLAMGDVAGLNRTASIGTSLLCAVAVVLFAATLGMAAMAPVLFDIPVGLHTEVRWTIALIGTAIAIQFPLFAFSAAIAAAQRHEVLAGISIFVRIASAVATVGALTAGYGLIGVSAVAAVANVLEYLARWIASVWILPEMNVRILRPRFDQCRSLLSFGAWNTLLSTGPEFIAYTSTLLIGGVLSAAAVPRFGLAASLALYFSRFFAPISWALFPAAAGMDARGDRPRLRNLFLVGTRLTLGLAAGVALIAICWSGDFYRLWLDGKLLGAPSVDLLFQLLVGGAVIRTAQQTASQILLGAGRVRALALIATAEGFAALTLSALLISNWGLTGVAIGTLVSAVVFRGVVQTLVTTRFLEMPLFKVLLSACLRPAVAAAVLAPALITIRSLSGPVRNWGDLALQGLIACAAMAAIMVLIVATRSEQREWFAAVARRIPNLSGFGLSRAEPVSREPEAIGTGPT